MDSVAVAVPCPPALIPHVDWPFPGMSPEDSARAAIARSQAYFDMLAAVIKSQGNDRLVGVQVKALVPLEWRELCGQYTHASLGVAEGSARGIVVEHVSHEMGGFHTTYRAKSSEECVAWA